MTTEKRREIVEYVNVCTTCGKEFEVIHEYSAQEICYSCKTKAATTLTKAELKRFIGAKIIGIEPVDNGACTSPREIMQIDVKLDDGMCARFTPCGEDGELYIDWQRWTL